MYKGNVWAIRGSAFYRAEQFEQFGSDGQFARCPLSTCLPNRVINTAIGHCLEHMAIGERVLKSRLSLITLIGHCIAMLNVVITVG